MYSILRSAAFAGALLLAPSVLAAASPEPVAGNSPLPNVQTATTHHTVRIGNESIRYTATAGTVVLTNGKDEPTASVFYVAYTADDLRSAQRAITFAYNGGPGSASAFIHLGAFGPRRVVTSNGTATSPPPYAIVDNSNSLLDTSDLVFIDAVGTGFSRIIGHGTAKDYYGVDQDGHAFEQFIRRYITANDRWNSPKYLAGESYGTARSAVLANMLQKDGISLSGITLISTVLDYSTLIAQPGNDLPYWLFLPSEAAVAAYHHKLPDNPSDIPAFLRAVRAYAQGPFMQALAQGSRLSPSEHDAIVAQLHADTGLPVDYLVRSRLRVEPDHFEKQLLSGTGETVGRYDGRFHNDDLDPITDGTDWDPSLDAVFGAFNASFNRYIRDELHYRTEAKYEFLNADVNRQWQWDRGSNGSLLAVNVCTDLRDAMTTNPYLRVFSANGIYDLATPFFATEYSLAHLGLAPKLQAHISFGYYPAGHMIYLNPQAHTALKGDLARFYR